MGTHIFEGNFHTHHNPKIKAEKEKKYNHEICINYIKENEKNQVRKDLVP